MGLIYKILLALLPLFLFSFFREEPPRLYLVHGYAQGTDYHISYYAKDSLVTRGQVDSLLQVIDSSMSLYKPYSQIARFNAGVSGLSIDPHFARVMKRSFEIYKDTQGKFDVTVGPLVQAWGFGPKPVTTFPDSTALKEMMKYVGMDKLQLKGNLLTKTHPEVRIDLNGIAQGYSVDVVANYLSHKKIKAFVVEIGGELRIRGPKPDGSPMRIGIEGPSETVDAEPVIRHTIRLNAGAITTSGNYRKYLQKGGKRISHLINPKTGYPLDNQLISVTVYAEDAITADGYDNAIMAMELEEALAFVSAKKKMEAYIIYRRRDGSVADTLTTGFRKMLLQ
ncbi:Thiamine biosynthesis lipoprotein ApbE [Pedobacter sp. BAL39]|uniref:FAD:protein FMN transferase n=1 Tax=Pedobacter sp. BAL39 TaxID=391596 RepID=UPI000155993F|nr:FAD:protein FMN transferase [Pedobacter sp. BAL39]EDM35772.1 Thiamine biosynthesis lipoprotein ApbE [Pedobacter sp. BAL39]